MIVRDPDSGQGMRVNDEGQGMTFSVIEPVERHQNRAFSKAWSIPFDVINPTGADDYFFYFKNTGDKLYAIEHVRVECEVTGTCELHHVSGTASTVTAVTPVNMFLGSSRAVTASVGTSVDFTGLTNEGKLFFIPVIANTESHLNITAGVFVPPGEAFALLWDTATGSLTGSVTIVEIDDERV